ncbi:SgcJ/EcaC family oxidoreductase [Actinoplanes sp. CA-252034]|uniref:SgcJ/EcaC family oxidoreductase n=1 Tax=Actinoplanes sp. CA-252034 TaxID=3239906 RepID=UPI003D96175E
MSTDDLAALRRLFEIMNDAWARADAETFGSVFTEDADYVIYTGTHYRGRAKIIDTHDALWTRFLRGTRLHGEIDSVRFPTPDVAIVVSRGAVLKRRNSKPRTDKIQTLVAVRRTEGWLFTAFQNTQRKPLLEWISSRSEPRMAP